MMTPLDMVRAMTPGVPPSPSSKPINIPLFESDPEQLRRELSEVEVPEFFKFGSSEDLGLVSYGRFLIFLTLLSIPSEHLHVAYHMSCGRNFKNPELRSDGLRSTNLDFIIARHIKTRDHGYQSSNHSKTSINRRFFGPGLDRIMTFEEFQQLHRDLKHEVTKLEYFLLSDRDGMSLYGLAKSIAALAPADYRPLLEKKAEALRDADVPPQVLISKEPLAGEDYDPPLEELEGYTASHWIITLEEYEAWKEVLKQLENMGQAVRLYQHVDGRFSPTGLMRAARAVAGVDLSKAVVWVIFKLFDADENEQLTHDEFVKLMIPHSVLQGKLQGPEGLGLHLLGSCCIQCFRDWLVPKSQQSICTRETNVAPRYDGTIIVDEVVPESD